MIQAVLFDAVGTLIRPFPSVARIYTEAGIRYGCKLPEEVVAARFQSIMTRNLVREQSAVGSIVARSATSEEYERQRWRTVVGHVFKEANAIDALFEDLWETFAAPDVWQVHPLAAEVWAELRRRGYRVGIASNFDQRLHSVCQGLPPLDSADHIFCSARLGYSKPDPRFFRAIEQELGLDARALLLVGDDPISDRQGAVGAGWQVLLVDPDEEDSLKEVLQRVS